VITSGITPTPEQAEIISAAPLPDPVLCNAYAGSAKSTTLVLAAPGIRVPALALAFNKRNAQDLRPRLPGNFQTLTLNGLGHMAWARALPPHVHLEIDDRKLGKLVSATAREHRVELTEAQWSAARQTVTLAMQAGAVPDDQGEPLVQDSPELWQEFAIRAGAFEDEVEFTVALARDVLRASIALARNGTISFDDQVYCPVVLGGRWPKFPAALVDEFQDLSELNFAMLRACTRPDAKLVIAGDIRQSIYAFRGAAGNAYDLARAMRPEWLELPLTMTFRCPRVIVSRQRHHAPGFTAAECCVEGEYHTLGTYEDPSWTWGALRALGDGTCAVLCRNNAPLLKLGFALIRQSIAPVMLGRDIGKGLSVLARRMLDERDNAELMLGKIEEWRITESSKGQNVERPELLASIEDRAGCLVAVIEGTEARDRGQLISALDNLFSRENGQITLSTIHRAKGLEWDLVLHLDPWRVPSKRARTESGEALVQERNLRYVCETRTRNVLAEASVDGFY
jgi:hypothetical protein